MNYHYGKWESFVQVVLFSEATNVLSLWEVGVLCLGCPLLRGNKCISLWEVGVLCSEVVLFSEATNVLSHGKWE